MLKKIVVSIIVITMIASVSLLSGCVQQQQQGSKVQLGSGTLRLLITDKPPKYSILYANVTISQVQVHKAETINETEYNTSSGGAFNVSANGPYTADVGATIQLQGNASGGQKPYNWSWDFGDGGISFLQNPQHQYSTHGVYLVNLTVTDDKNTTAWDQTVAYIGQEENENESGWLTVVNETHTFDLIALRNVTELLGETNLTAGKYTQIRLTVESATITINSSDIIEEKTLQVPSDKIKLIHPFTIVKNETTVLTLDFDVDTSIHQTGNGKFILKPTIKITQE